MTPVPDQPNADEARAHVDDMLRTMDARIRALDAVSQRSIALVSQARDQLLHFRVEPLGGRLLGLKRLVYWFSASAFDRQAKVQDAILTALDEIARELVELRNRTAVLRNEVEQQSERPGANPRLGNGGA